MDTAWTPHATRVEEPVIRHIATADVLEALRLGWRDFKANPTQLIFLAVLYPIIGLLAARAMAGGAVMPLIWPLVSGFALVGPFAALGIYELSRRQEQGLPVSWYHGLEVRHSPALWSILVLGMLLVGIFLAWLVVAQFLYGITLGAARDVVPPAGFMALVDQVFSTPEGLKLMVLGTGAGLLLAVLVLVLTVVSFPLLLDRGASGRIVDVGTAIRASVRAVTANPGPMALWGLIVAALLALGSLPLFVGLAVVLPVLGHATWHLYRKVVAD